jgi:hypothetical protein
LFEVLKPGSAMALGVVGGVLLLGTIGFIVLGVVMLKGKPAVTTAKADDSAQTAQTQTQTQQQAAQPAAAAVVKSDKPKVELFVMAYCPFGLQMEKAYLPVMELLKNKAQMDVKFVYYSMHGQKEVEENTRQYCIQKEQSDKYIPYLKCFTAADDSKGCLAKAGVNENKMNACFTATDKQFGIMADYNDQSKWLSGQFPLYPVYADLNTKYNVQGSPTLIINGVEAQAARTPEDVKKAVCNSFTSAPSECNTTLSKTPASSGFGTAAGTDANAAACGS